ncbi:sigma-70 family RNA polymerase sigma factor [Streptomyces sp. NPDC052236]|uniref:sigma-70 family RNA polymerase sigma factor n=1 Tax=Streptomyces sp. NPDC052236 TaxID=3365686 RepID=UPI0037CD900C
MNEHDWLAERFESDRPRLRAAAYRMLGSLDEADDAVQETWIRVSRSDTGAVENLSGWLTTIVARISLNMLQSRKSRREALLDTAEAGEPRVVDRTVDPEQEALLADSVGLALLVVLDTLTPAERLAFVLHDMFAVPFQEIAHIVDRSPAAARQLASRARRRVQQAGSDMSPEGTKLEGLSTEGTGPHGASAHDDVTDTAQTGRADLVHAFLAASREGNFEALLAMLDPDIVLRADQAAVQMGVAAEIRSADAVTRVFAGRAWAPLPALINGAAGLVWAEGGQPRVVFRFTIDDGKITAIDVQAELAGLDIVMR